MRRAFTEEEKELVIAAGLRIWRESPPPGGLRGCFNLARAAALPPERQTPKPALALSSYPWFTEAMRKRLVAGEVPLKSRPRMPRPKVVPVPPLLASIPQPVLPEPAPAAPAPAPVQAPAIPAPSVGPTPSLTSLLLSQWAPLRERLVEEVASIVTEGLALALTRAAKVSDVAQPAEGAAVAVALSGIVSEKKAPESAKQSVLVVGLKGSQVTEIERSFSKCLDLRFCSSDQSKDQLRRMSATADVVVGFTDFLSHSHEDIVKARAAHYIRSGGGMTSLKATLGKLIGDPAANESGRTNGHAVA